MSDKEKKRQAKLTKTVGAIKLVRKTKPHRTRKLMEQWLLPETHEAARLM